ncbi:MAG: HAD family hydrolase [Candidatus Kapabacteria bacterium]|nr:HAD family hydrolase [Candidatus Kapabacteria bacterium]
MPVKVITIDFWNTLFDSSAGTERNTYRRQSLVKEIKKLNAELSEIEFNSAMEASWAFFNDNWLNHSRTPEPSETVKFFMDFLHLDFTAEQFDKVVWNFAESVLVFPPKLIDGVPQALESLSSKFKLGLISDTGFSPGTVLRELMKRTNIYQYFSAFSFSDETKVSKPHPKAYLTVLNELECNPEDAVHIGDIAQTDIKGAKNLSMRAIRFIGDQTSMVLKNTDIQIEADWEAESWHEIVKIINEITN